MNWIKRPVLLFAIFAIPTKTLTGWQIEKFTHIKPNSVSASQNGLTVEVNSSASPLIYKLATPLLISGFQISGEFKGLPHFSDVSKQGRKGFDDYALRVGFIVPGSKRLSGIKKFFAAAWVKHLYSELPAGAGLDHIQFFDVTQNLEQLGQEHTSPSSNLIHENVFADVTAPGPFFYKYKLSAPLKSAAVWISIDGDDTKSKYTVVINQIKLDGANVE